MTEIVPGTVGVEKRGHILHISLDRQKKMNAFTPEMFAELGEALTRLDESADLWVGIISFAGQHTTAGLDLPLFRDSLRSGDSATNDDKVDAFGLHRRCRKPLVMAVQGVCYTIGIEMMLGCDIVVAADDARFCQLEPKRGLAVFGGANIRYVERAGWGNAMYHLLRADEFNAERALQLGFVQEVVPAGAQVSRAEELAAEVAANAPIAIQAIKASALEYLHNGEAAAVAMIPEIRQRTANSADAAEGLKSFIERRDPVFQGK